MLSDDEEITVRNPYSKTGATAVRSSKRSRTSRHGEAQSAALEAIREAHKTGRVRRRDVSTLQKPVYEEVDEDEYQKIIRERQENDFVVDDDGSGYVDHGLDFFDDEELVEEYNEPRKKKAKGGKRKRLAEFFSSVPKAKKDDYVTGTISDNGEACDNSHELVCIYFLFFVFKIPGLVRSQTYRVNAVSLADDPDVEALLNEVEFNSSSKENSESLACKIPKRTVLHADFPDVKPLTNKLEFSNQLKEIDERLCAPKVSMGTETSTDGLDVKPLLNETKLDNPLKDNDGLLCGRETQTRTLPVAGGVDDKPSINEVIFDDPAKENDELLCAHKIPAWESANLGAGNLSGNMEEIAEVEAGSSEARFFSEKLEGKISVKMFWLDAFEDPIRFPGTVYIFGRVLNNGKSESCCLVVKNIWRQIFFLPNESIACCDASNAINASLYNEVHSLLKKIGATTLVDKKFAFNDGNIPSQASVLEVQYSFCYILSLLLKSNRILQSAHPALPANLKGETFTHVFNTTSTAMERLLLEAELKGPCWIEVSECMESAPRVSYTKHEYIVNGERMKSISILDISDPPPTINILGLNIISVVNDKAENEIGEALLYVSLQSVQSVEVVFLLMKFISVVTKPAGKVLPFSLKTHLSQSKLEKYVKEASNERHLLSQLLCKIQTLDPDAYLGHDLGAQFSVLSSRLEKLKIANWSCTSRLRRTIAIKQLGHTKAASWGFNAGRFVLDSRSSSMELIRSRSYDLVELAESVLQFTWEPITSISTCYSSAAGLVSLISSSFDELWLSFSLIARLNALPLFVKITQIVGGVLSRTMMGGRAERNEYLLLHAFRKSGYVAPDKYQKGIIRSGFDAADQNVARDEGEVNEKSSRKAQYSGGLVLDPKKGLYNNYVLLLDFNSLYPSIIQEFNICFTTVAQNDTENETPAVLTGRSEEGILPREIRALIERRREVKKLMKSDRISEQLRTQYDIRQMGLKLTANSMYGCLGFVQSRFYAKSLAALITLRGREILTATKDAVEKLGYTVIYGDTDSIMIDTGLLDLEQVKRLGHEIKKNINKRYKAIELDLDGVYRRLLLLKKKKYVGLAVDLSTGKLKREAKGLDIIRRDWSGLAKEIGMEVVDIILSDLDEPEMVGKIHETLGALGESLRAGKIENSKFQILKQLTRGVDDYEDAKTQPHVAVAQRLNSTGDFRFHRGDIVPYDGTSNSAVQRAYHLTEMEKNKELKIDTHYYLAQQIHPVVSRLDGNNYRARINFHIDENQSETAPGAQLDFSECEPFTFRCPYSDCNEEVTVREPFLGDVNIFRYLQKTCSNALHFAYSRERKGIVFFLRFQGLNIQTWLDNCPFCTRSFLPFSSYFNNQLVCAITSHINSYYLPLYVCDDITCAFQTRRQGLNWSRDGVRCPKCSYGFLKQKYSRRRLFAQQTFYRSIFDFEKGLTTHKLEQQILDCSSVVLL
ncbi:unnamed protein product [Enterobius vermicularis]|uniref:DNA polymerase n=1 Tax=Enterobius vermicularis TaxID=51028 RepID=A0A158Q9Y5_ENTVE|nr:unnamed protein product [Enterobius vermicularis]